MFATTMRTTAAVVAAMMRMFLLRSSISLSFLVNEADAAAHGLEVGRADRLGDDRHPAFAGLADEDRAVGVDLFDDRDMAVVSAGAVHAGLEADHVAGLRAPANLVSEAGCGVVPLASVAHVRVDGFADLVASHRGPPGALVGVVVGKRV